MSWQVKIRARRGSLFLDVEMGGEKAPVALIGPNGSGKTTVLQMIVGACRPDSGHMELSGESLFCSRRGVELPSEKRAVGYVPQGYGLFPHLTVQDNVAFGLSTGPRKQGREARRAVARRILDELQCESLSYQWPSQLSGGERQRVALARALVVTPRLLLLDEPLAALDVAVRRSVRALLAERIAQAQLPTLLVTHDARDIAALDAYIYVLQAGRIVQRGTLAQLQLAPFDDFVAEFVEILPTAGGAVKLKPARISAD